MVEHSEYEGFDSPAEFDPFPDADPVESQVYKHAWAGLLASCEALRGGSPFICPKCGSEMKVIAVIQEREEIRRILRHLVKHGRPPPGLDPASLN